VAYKRFFTSESVTEGHPDKVADAISDAVLDALLKEDPQSRVAIETFAITGQIHLAGEVTTKTYIDIPRIVRETVKGIGYTRAKYGFDADTCGVIVTLDEQSPDIAQGVDTAYELQHDPGDDDPLVPLANARFLARRIPDARLHVVAGGGHLFLIDQPRDAAPVLNAFLACPDTGATPWSNHRQT